MSKKALRVIIYDANQNVVIEKTPVTVDAIPAALQLMPDGGSVRVDIVEYSADSVA